MLYKIRKLIHHYKWVLADKLISPEHRYYRVRSRELNEQINEQEIKLRKLQLQCASRELLIKGEYHENKY